MRWKQLKGDVDRIRECTSVRYDGIIALLKPDESWVGRWQRIGAFFSAPPPHRSRAYTILHLPPALPLPYLLSTPTQPHPAATLLPSRPSVPNLTPPRMFGTPVRPVGKFTKGLYAARVIGRLPKDAIEEVESKGFSYVPRDEIGKI